LKKGSKAAKAWGAKMRRLRGGGKKRKKSTRKGQRRKTRAPKARRAYTKVKSKAKSYKRKNSSSGMKIPKIPSVIKKVGAASLAGMAVGLIAPQFSGIARPIAALAAGGIPGVAGELLINQGLLGNITGMFGGGAQAPTGGL